MTIDTIPIPSHQVGCKIDEVIYIFYFFVLNVQLVHYCDTGRHFQNIFFLLLSGNRYCSELNLFFRFFSCAVAGIAEKPEIIATVNSAVPKPACAALLLLFVMITSPFSCSPKKKLFYLSGLIKLRSLNMG